MYKVAVFSDVHANLPALEAVLADIDVWRADAVVCLGDLVDFAPWPNEVIAKIRERKILTVMGNHDERIAFDRPVVPLKKHSIEERMAREAAIAWTRDAVTEESRSYLRSLPMELRTRFALADGGREVLFTHASPRSIDTYVYEDHPEDDLEEMLAASETDVLVIGHTHLPYVRVLAETERVVVNVGSVGRTKERSAAAVYCRLTMEDAVRAEIVRVDYDVSATAAAIRGSGIPGFYAEFLERSAVGAAG